MRSFIYPYRTGSKSVKDLSLALDAKRIKMENSKYRERDNKVVINWGSSSCPYQCINSAKAVNTAADKLLSFKAMDNHGVCVPCFTEEEDVAQGWYREGHRVVGRAKLVGSGGDGILITDTFDYPQAEGGMDVIHMREVTGNVMPLYVKYIPKKDEYRVHVMNGEVIDVQRKMRNRDVADADVNWKVRNHANGFIFGREGVELPADAAQESIAAVKALGLDFGAVDIIYNEKENKSYVLEVNTAPGLEGMTLETYKEAFKRNYL